MPWGDSYLHAFKKHRSEKTDTQILPPLLSAAIPFGEVGAVALGNPVGIMAATVSDVTTSGS